MSPGRIVVVGDVMVDVITRPEGPVVAGSDRAAEIRVRPGGSGANQAAWIGHLGAAVCLLARVGAADAADQAALLRSHGVEPHLAADTKRLTGMLVTLLAPDGERSFLTDRGANLHLCAADLPLEMLTGTALLHVSGYALFTPGPRAAAIDLMREAMARGIAVSIDAASAAFLSGIGSAAFLDWTSGATICFANADEAAVLGGADTLAGRFDTVVVKRGAAGAIALRGGERIGAAAPVVPVIDTSGAGDAFVAGFLVAWREGATLTRCVEQGVRLGARAVGQLGGRPP